ncbi:VOC family protein [Comamonas sp. GB3 AK4-5]|uniref:VOC family protein n=1 Tax=Comamonas sp. GB3 AK4-5 TaxID=3231487 RepID=UPI00351F7D04
MFSHIMVGTNNLDAAHNFYNSLLGTLGAKPGFVDRHRIFWRHAGNTFSVSVPINGEPANVGNGSTFGFATESIEQANAAHTAGLAAGGVTCEDPPGWRGEGKGAMYLAYLRDPDGNKICLVYRQPKA